uniref:Poly [ADP-ribose] polymerase n=1 Tax=Neobodo designis TaxID=312471 RepID=A0A7S1LRM7_NEODS
MPRQPDWNCPKCGHLVFGSKPSCFKCGTTNPAGGSAGGAIAPPTAAPPAAAGKVPDWPCPNCNIIVFGSKPACFKCGAKNPGSAGAPVAPAVTATPKAADWTCPTCALVVFASKPACPKCQTPRPTASATAVDLSKREAELKQREFELEQRLAGAAATDLVAAVPRPAAWGSATTAQALDDVILEPVTDAAQFACFSALVTASTPDTKVPKGFKLLKVWRVKNTALWVQFGTLRQLFSAGTGKKRLPYIPKTTQHLDKRVMAGAEDASGLSGRALATLANEAFLFHGTKPDIAKIITAQGFDERVASLSGLFGGGVYFADNFAKSNAYTSADASGTRHMFVARVLLGDMTDVMSSSKMPRNARRAPDGFDTVCGLSNAHEFIVYDRRQTYPEFLMEYAMTA